mmetsp:Transcript_2476/g.4915  ORF Transcript_2476/g.4915 Transcript_2476/m.4915 type:complete len:263 (+) Transcript_2476:1327-2115(+)
MARRPRAASRVDTDAARGPTPPARPGPADGASDAARASAGPRGVPRSGRRLLSTRGRVPGLSRASVAQGSSDASRWRRRGPSSTDAVVFARPSSRCTGLPPTTARAGGPNASPSALRGSPAGSPRAAVRSGPSRSGIRGGLVASWADGVLGRRPPGPGGARLGVSRREAGAELTCPSGISTARRPRVSDDPVLITGKVASWADLRRSTCAAGGWRAKSLPTRSAPSTSPAIPLRGLWGSCPGPPRAARPGEAFPAAGPGSPE